MGMDVYGKKPTGYVDGNECDAASGHYFRSNVWWWYPLWGYIQDLHPQIAIKAPNADFNDGDGLGARDSKLLAKKLRIDLADGTVDNYISTRDASIKAMPDEPCEVCNGEGIRNDATAVKHGFAGTECTGCNGKGERRPWEASYHLNRESIEEFTLFLENCGGFEIW